MITRIQLGASRLESLPPEVLQKFLDKSWMHLGDPKSEKTALKTYSISYLLRICKKYSISYIFSRGVQKIFGKKGKTAGFNLKISELYKKSK